MKLFTPGPTPVPDSVRQRLAGSIIHHRTPEFRAVFKKVQQKLKKVFCTKQDVWVLSASGTAAMEAAVVNLCNPGDRILVLEMGKFSERWTEIALTYGLACERLSVEWGRSILPEQVEEKLKQNPNYHAIFMTHSETSTGAALNLKAISDVIRKHSQALLIVDGMSSVGAMPLLTDEWGLDGVISGSQKGFMCPPGLSFITCSNRAWEVMQQARLPRYYLDLRRAREALKNFDTPFTPAISEILALEEALNMVCAEGIESRWRHHEILAQATRAAVSALGLLLVAEYPSNALTAVWIPENLRNVDLIRQLKRRGFQLAGGQGKLKGKIMRIGHLGFISAAELIELIEAMEEVLAENGWPFEKKSAVKAFQTVIRKMDG